jgi:hypothetical protein
VSMWVLLQVLPEGFKELAPSLEAEVSPAFCFEHPTSVY